MSKISHEALLTQLGFRPNKQILNDLRRVLKSLSSSQDIIKHLVVLNDKIKHYGSSITLSSTTNYFKIKIPNPSQELQSEIDRWADKYKVKLIKTTDSNNYYIAGRG